MQRVEARFRVITPLFLGGANPHERAEIRAPSIKAALRYWCRAVDPDYRRSEGKIFGGAGGVGVGQSIFLLRSELEERSSRERTSSWDPGSLGIQNQQSENYASRPAHASSDNRTWRLNGLQYFSFALRGMGGDARCYIDVNDVVSVSLLFRRAPERAYRQRISAALWLLGHVGGLGSRSRRAFGTIALSSWRISEGTAWPELDELPIAHGQDTVEKWMADFRKGCEALKIWFPGPKVNDHTNLGANTRFKLFNFGRADWAQSLNDAGLAMQTFRQRYELSDPNSDYFRVKKHICQNEPRTAGTPGSAVGSAPLTTGPQRAAFGLPLTFRYSSLAYQLLDRRGSPILDRNGNPRMKSPETTFDGIRSDRSASRIHVRVVKIGANFHPFYIRFDGPLLEPAERVKDKWGNYSAPGDSILDDFWAVLPASQEMAW